MGNKPGIGVVWSLLLLGLVLTVLVVGLQPVYAKSPHDSKQPRYAVLSEQMEKLQKSGELRRALGLISRIYACEDIPVSAYYKTLANQRLFLLRRILEKNSHTCLQKEFYQLLSRPDHARRDLSGIPHLPGARFLYLCLAGIRKNQEQTKPGLEGLDLKACVQSNDPWLVSAALFAGRKGVFNLTWPDVEQRARARSDLWDKACAEQALVFWASLDHSKPGKKVPEFILGPETEALTQKAPLVPQGNCLVQLGLFDPRVSWFARQDPFFQADFWVKRKNCEPQEDRRMAVQLRAGTFLELSGEKGEFSITPKGDHKKKWTQTVKCLPGKCIRLSLPGR
jgi:hypothetical protein